MGKGDEGNVRCKGFMTASFARGSFPPGIPSGELALSHDFRGQLDAMLLWRGHGQARAQAHLVLASDIPHGERNVLVFDGLHVEACRAGNMKAS